MCLLPVITLQGKKIWYKVYPSFFQRNRTKKGHLGHRNGDHRGRLVSLDLGGGSERFVAVPERMGKKQQHTQDTNNRIPATNHDSVDSLGVWYTGGVK